MTDYQSKCLDILNHTLRNGTGNIEGLIRQIENQAKFMRAAIKTYGEEFENEEPNRDADTE